MSIKVRCTNGHSFKVLDRFAGETVACSKCGVLVPVPDLWDDEDDDPRNLAAIDKGEDDYEDDESPRRRRRRRSGGDLPNPLGPVRLGLAFFYAWILLIPLGIMIGMVSFVNLLAHRRNLAALPIGQLLIAIVVGFGLPLLVVLGFVKPFLSIVGEVFLFRTPPQTRAKPLVIAMLIIDALLPILAGVSLLFVPFGLIFVLILVLASWILFMLYLSNFLSFFSRREQSSDCLVVMIWGIVLAASLVVIVPMIIFVAVRFLGARVSTPIIYLAFLSWIVAAAVLMFRNLSLISALRQCIEEAWTK